MARVVFVDTNLLLLLCVGLADRNAIARHRRLQAFDVIDFDLLRSYLETAEIAVLPNVATETSNLLRQTKDPDRSRISAAFRRIAKVSEEKYVPTRIAVDHPQYLRLGVTDAAILQGLLPNSELMTEDVDLYLAAAGAGIKVINFNHIREIRPDFRA